MSRYLLTSHGTLKSATVFGSVYIMDKRIRRANPWANLPGWQSISRGGGQD
ncbi:MAG: hypothetical protein LBC45_05315 [Chlamydiales bacterium]|nr:hypothetical protein [Chlamydiales bacterium]